MEHAARRHNRFDRSRKRQRVALRSDGRERHPAARDQPVVDCRRAGEQRQRKCPHLQFFSGCAPRRHRDQRPTDSGRESRIAALAGQLLRQRHLAFGPAQSYRQRCRRRGQCISLRLDRRAGAGCPTTRGVPFGSPSTRAARGALGCPVLSAQPDAVAASAARRTVRPPPRRQARRCRGTERGSTAGRQ